METTSANRLLTVNLPLGGQNPSGFTTKPGPGCILHPRFLELS